MIMEGQEPAQDFQETLLQVSKESKQNKIEIEVEFRTQNGSEHNLISLQVVFKNLEYFMTIIDIIVITSNDKGNLVR
jgi:hypothetical protein